MKPTYYLNLQVCAYEDDIGWHIVSEKIIDKSTNINLIYREYDKRSVLKLRHNVVRKPDDSLLAEDNA